MATTEILTNATGLIGGLFFAFAAVPTALATIKAGRSVGTPASIAWQITCGCILLYCYLTAKNGFDPILTLTYGVETASWVSILWFHYFPKSR